MAEMRSFQESGRSGERFPVLETNTAASNRTGTAAAAFVPANFAWIRIVPKRHSRIHIGTSGWSYPSWRGPFFPKEVMIKHHLAYYATQFETAELNGVFYRTPSLDAVRGWRDRTPDGFIFAWKASKFITHWKRLSERSVNSLELIEERLKILGEKAGPVLFQLPPRFEANPERLQSFLALLAPGRRYAFEFRHASWYTKEIFAILHKSDIALCISDHHDAPAPWIATASFVYVRGHGPGGKYHGNYSDSELGQWTEHVAKWRKQRREVFVYFDNDQKSAAPADALRLGTMLRKAGLRTGGA